MKFLVFLVRAWLAGSCVWLGLELNSAGHRPSRTELGHFCITAIEISQTIVIILCGWIAHTSNAEPAVASNQIGGVVLKRRPICISQHPPVHWSRWHNQWGVLLLNVTENNMSKELQVKSCLSSCSISWWSTKDTNVLASTVGLVTSPMSMPSSSRDLSTSVLCWGMVKLI